LSPANGGANAKKQKGFQAINLKPLL